jgi:hypothetical protein
MSDREFKTYGCSVTPITFRVYDVQTNEKGEANFGLRICHAEDLILGAASLKDLKEMVEFIESQMVGLVIEDIPETTKETHAPLPFVIRLGRAGWSEVNYVEIGGLNVSEYQDYVRVEQSRDSATQVEIHFVNVSVNVEK